MHTEENDPFTYEIIGAAIEVHRELGPGLLESTYQKCLSQELKLRNIEYRAEVILPIQYKGIQIDDGYRIDILFPEKLIVELKSVKALEPIHTAQLMTYLKLSKIQKGLLINFNVLKLTDGVQRVMM